MVQIIILVLASLGLVGSIFVVYEKGGDSRENQIRAEVSAEKTAIRKEKEAHEKQMRDFALALTKGYLTFQSGQQRYFSGVKDEIIGEIQKRPELRLVCLDAGGVLEFNQAGLRREGGAVPSASPGDGGVHQSPTQAEGKSP
jgi:hypothetical protein